MAIAVYLATLSFLLGCLAVDSIQACGGNFTSLSGIIQSPNYPGNYSNQENCVYSITAPDNHRITLNFTNFDLEFQGNCNFDYVEDGVSAHWKADRATSHQQGPSQEGDLRSIAQSPRTIPIRRRHPEVHVRDGDSDTSPRIGRYCGQTLPNRIRTFGHQMWIKFVSDGSVTGSGFRATYTAAVLQDAFFLISSTTSGSPLGDIFRMDPETITNYAIPMSNRLYNPIAVDYDPVNKTIYWTEVGVLNRIRASSLNGSGVRTLKDAGEGSVLDGLAVDAKSRLIFYTDAGKDEIVMMTMNTLAHKTVINSSLDNPRAIVLNTADGVMFWTDWGKPTKIERASYDGTNRQILITDAIGLINALALDVPNNRLYWADAFTDKVEVVDMEGKGRKILFSTQVSFNGHFFGLALYHDVLYITNWGKDGSYTRNSSLLSMHLTSGEIRSVGSANGNRLNDIHAYSEVSFDTSPNGCGNNNGGCSVFCIPLPGNSSRCTCPDGQTVTSDLKTCVDAAETTVGTTENTTPRHTEGSVSTAAETTIGTTDSTTPRHTEGSASTVTKTTIGTTDNTTPRHTEGSASTVTKTTIGTTDNTTPRHTEGSASTVTKTTIRTTDSTTPRHTEGSASTVTKTTVGTTDNTTPRHTEYHVIISTSDPMPFDTNGQREMNLTCDLTTALTVSSYQWNVRCSRQVGNTCIFAPQPPEDDGKTVTCTITTAGGQVHTGVVEIELNYPPQQAPEIQGYTKNDTLKVGQQLSMICSVTGGKPLVKAVIFSCDGHPDTSQDIRTSTEVNSILSIHSLQPEDDGSRCVCTAEWKDKDWYRLSAVTTLRLQGQESSNEDTSKPTPDITIIAGGSAGGVCFILVLTVCIVCIVKRKWTHNTTRKQRRGQHPEENPYSVLYADRNSQAFSNRAFTITNGQNMGRCGSGIYDLADENEGNSDYTTVKEMDKQMSVNDEYLTPTEHHHHQHPVPGKRHKGRLTSPADDYLHPCHGQCI